MSRVEAGDRLSLVFASWLGMTATLNWILRVEGASRVLAGNGLGFFVRYLAGYSHCSLLD